MKTPKYENYSKYIHSVKKNKASENRKKENSYNEADSILTSTKEIKDFKRTTCELSNEDLELVSGGTSINMNFFRK